MSGGPSHLVSKALVTATGGTSPKRMPDWCADLAKLTAKVSANSTGVSFNGATPVAKQTLPAAATDAATTQALVNAIRAALIANGLAQ